MHITSEWIIGKLEALGWKRGSKVQVYPTNASFYRYSPQYTSTAVIRPEGVTRRQEKKVVSHLMCGHEIVRHGSDFVPVSLALMEYTGLSAQEIVGKLVTKPRAVIMEYEDERYCTNCKDDTPHRCYDSGHERDSSNDWAECKKCKWRWLGLTGKYEAPYNEG